MVIRSRNKKDGTKEITTSEVSNDSLEVKDLDVSKKVIGTSSDEFIEHLVLTLILPPLTSNICMAAIDYAPKLADPYVGNFFSTYFFNYFICLSLGLGSFIGVIYKDKFLQLISPNIGRIALFLSLSPAIFAFFANYSMTFGPYFSTHIAYIFPVYHSLFSCAWINVSLFLKNIDFFKNTDMTVHSIFLLVTQLATFVGGLALFKLFPSISYLSTSCYHVITYAFITALILCFLNFTLLQNTRPSLSQKVAVPIVVMTCVLFMTTRHQQCHPGLTDKHLDAQNPMVSGYVPLARSESITGWITVTDETERNFRIMRSGHSLLGGIFLDSKESIFPTFYFYEAVRYVVKPNIPNQREKALQIGLGAGIATRELIKRGVDVDLVEIDPVVYKYAREYFYLPEPNNVFIEDAKYFLNKKANKTTYDYLIHDVFTGGTVPESLFSFEALTKCRETLKPEGILALNFVGGAQGPYLPGFEAVVSTIKSVFPHVRIFTEEYDHKDPNALNKLVNLIIFAADFPIEFSFPNRSDSYEYSIRDYVIYSIESYEVDLTKYLPKLNELAPPGKLLDVLDPNVVTDNNNKLKTMQHYSAYKHWEAMKNLLPLEYWIGY